MVADHPEHDFVFLFDRPFDPAYLMAPNVTARVVYPPARHPVLFWWWFEQSVPRVLQQEQADVFLSTDNFLSLQTSVPTVLVVHDLAFEHYPQDMGRLVRKYYHYFMPRYAHKAQRIAAVSGYTKDDLVRQYGVAPEKIDVVYNGVNEEFSPLPESEQGRVRAQFSEGKPYFLFVGAIHPRKNLINLLRAYDLFRQRTDRPVRLLIAGRKGWHTDEIFQTWQSLAFQEDVVFLGRVAQTDLPRLYGAAEALAYVPYFEGFGIPVIEAQQCGCPVVTSDVSSLPEVAGEAALLVDPFQPEAIAAALTRLAQEPALAAQLRRAGLANVRRFSWNQSAQQLWATLCRTSGLNER